MVESSRDNSLIACPTSSGTQCTFRRERNSTIINHQGEKILESPNLDLHDEQLNEKPVGDEVGEIRNEVPNVPDQVPDQPQNEEEDNEEQPLPRASRNRRPPERYGNPDTFSTTQQEKP